MQSLTIINLDGALYVDSREIASILEIKHWEILRKLKGRKNSKGYIQILTDNQMVASEYFIPSTYKDVSGKENENFLFTRLGCDFIANKFTGEKGIVFTAKYVKQFNEMERLLQEHNSSQWQQTRLESKKNRRLEAEEIKQLVQYAKAQSSENAEKYYITLSKLANKTVRISSTERERANINQLNTLILVENIINHRIQEGIKQGLHYKEIYQSCKERLKQFKEIAYLTEIKVVEGK